MLQVVKALMHCHKIGVMHRDINPENIMVNEKGNVRLIDFGFAVEEKKKNGRDIAGTQEYIAPEVLTSN